MALSNKTSKKPGIDLSLIYGSGINISHQKEISSYLFATGQFLLKVET